MYLPWLTPEPVFPDPQTALEEPNGLLCAGGDLYPERLQEAYRNGIFPWYEEGQPLLWWSPDPRCVLYFDQLHISRSMRRFLSRKPFRFAFDQSFQGVMAGCAAPRGEDRGTWITADMLAAYQHLHESGLAHSIEVYEGAELVGGLYGVALGRCFFGESMFSRTTNASKAAFIMLARHLAHWGYHFLDAQVTNPHLLSLGATEIPRQTFLKQLRENVDKRLEHRWEIREDLVYP